MTGRCYQVLSPAQPVHAGFSLLHRPLQTGKLRPYFSRMTVVNYSQPRIMTGSPSISTHVFVGKTTLKRYDV